MDLESLKTNAYNSGQSFSEAQENAPGMLQDLKKNLYGIFAKDNPVITAREQALSDYLSTPQRTRADLLPTNLPMIEGRNLALSPTQQDAITASRSSAALAPLVGWNEILRGMTGSIGDVVKSAGDIYSAKLASMQSQAGNALDLYKAGIEEEKAKQSAAGSGGYGLDLATILQSLGGNLGVGTDWDSILNEEYSQEPVNLQDLLNNPGLSFEQPKNQNKGGFDIWAPLRSLGLNF